MRRRNGLRKESIRHLSASQELRRAKLGTSTRSLPFCTRTVRGRYSANGQIAGAWASIVITDGAMEIPASPVRHWPRPFLQILRVGLPLSNCAA